MTLSPADIEKELRYAHRFFTTPGAFVSNEPAEKVEEVIEEVIQDFKDMAKRFRPLSSADRAIVTLTQPKTAALLADRVWTTASDADPDIGFGWELPMEIRFRALLAIHHMFKIPQAPTATSSGPVPPQEIERFFTDLERDLARGFQDTTGATVLPLYNSASRRDAQYHNGNQAALVSIVENLQIVDEEQLTWAQISEFRRDKEARAAYRLFIHWLDKDMIDRPVQYIADEVAQRLERHEWALRKHGIKTVIGSLSSTINPKSLVATSTAGLAVNLIAGTQIWSLLTAGGLLVGHAALSMATALVERRDIELADREIAYVQKIKTHLGGAA